MKLLVELRSCCTRGLIFENQRSSILSPFMECYEKEAILPPCNSVEVLESDKDNFMTTINYSNINSFELFKSLWLPTCECVRILLQNPSDELKKGIILSVTEIPRKKLQWRLKYKAKEFIEAGNNLLKKSDN